MPVELFITIFLSVASLLIGIGITLTMSDPSVGELWFARSCFVIAALGIASLLIRWLCAADKPLIWALCVGAITGAILFPSTIGILRWVNLRTTPKITEPKPLPDVILHLTHPKSPALLLENRSDALARDIKYSVALWNLNLLPERMDPLPIPTATFDWIKPYRRGGPQGLFGRSQVASLLHAGDHLFGCMSVNCPDCIRGHTYIVSIVWQQGGWFAEIPSEKDGILIIPEPVTKEGLAAYVAGFSSAIPESSRIPIVDYDLSWKGSLEPEGAKRTPSH